MDTFLFSNCHLGNGKEDFENEHISVEMKEQNRLKTKKLRLFEKQNNKHERV